MIRKFIDLSNVNMTVKVEATRDPKEFYLMILKLGEETQMRLDEKGFFRRSITTADNIRLNNEAIKLTEDMFSDITGPDGKFTRFLTVEESAAWKKGNKDIEDKYKFRTDYIVKGLNAKELFDYYISLGLYAGEDELVTEIDETMESPK